MSKLVEWCVDCDQKRDTNSLRCRACIHLYGDLPSTREWHVTTRHTVVTYTVVAANSYEEAVKIAKGRDFYVNKMDRFTERKFWHPEPNLDDDVWDARISENEDDFDAYEHR